MGEPVLSQNSMMMMSSLAVATESMYLTTYWQSIFFRISICVVLLLPI